MSDNDESSVLEGTVEEVKQAIRDLEDPDYEELLKQEEEGKDRKTVKEFLEKRIGSEEEDVEETEDTEQQKTEEVEQEETEAKKPHKKVAKKASNNSALPLAAAGVVIGLLIGLAGGQMIAGTSGSPNKAASNVESIITSGGFNGTVDVGAPQKQHGMYYFNVSVTSQTPNGTQTNYQPAYVSKDGVLLFPEVRSFMLTSPINMPQTISRQTSSAGNVTN